MPSAGGLLSLCALVALLLLAVAACGGKGGKDRLTVVLDWLPNPDHAGIYTAQAKGYFEDEGLEVKLEPPGNPEDPPKFVAAGRADVALYYEPDVIQARAQGIPITAIGAIVNVPLNSIMVPRDSPIASPRDLAGKRIGYPGIPSNQAYMETVLLKAGVDAATARATATGMTDVGFELSKALQGRRVDAIIGGYWNVEAVVAELENFPLRIFRLEQHGVPTYDELVFIASEKSVREKKDVLRRFMRAVVKGHQYAADHPEEAIEAVAQASKDYGRPLIERSVRLLVPIWKDMKPFGRMDTQKWVEFVDFMAANKLIEKKPALDTLLTNEFVP